MCSYVNFLIVNEICMGHLKMRSATWTWQVNATMSKTVCLLCIMK